MGASAGDDLTIKLTFPEDYPGTEVAGKEAEFEVKLKEVGVPEMPEVDEEFIKTFGIEDGSVESFRKEIQTSLERERDQRSRAKIRQSVLEALMKDNEFEAP